MKSQQIMMEIEQLRQTIAASQQRLQELLQMLDVVREQEENRRNFINSKEIQALIEDSTGKTIHVSTIKRWADKGYFGQAYDERKLFWALDLGSGKQRFVFDRETVLATLYQLGYIRPKFASLDRVSLITEDSVKPRYATVIRHHLSREGFQYTIQFEGTMQIVEHVMENELRGES